MLEFLLINSGSLLRTEDSFVRIFCIWTSLLVYFVFFCAFPLWFYVSTLFFLWQPFSLIFWHFLSTFFDNNDKKQTELLSDCFNRGNRIWTCDLTAPSRARYQATPCPVTKVIITRVVLKFNYYFTICEKYCSGVLIQSFYRKDAGWTGLLSHSIPTSLCLVQRI